MNSYYELKQKQQKEFNDFPIAFAFSEEQFNEGMRKLGLKPTDTDKVYKIGFNGFIRKTDSAAFAEMTKRHGLEMEQAIAGDETGDGFIYDMFRYELDNHEFGYTWELEPTLEALGLTMEEIEADARLKHGLEKAIKETKTDW